MNASETIQIRRKITQGNLLFGDYTLVHVIAQGARGVICEGEHNTLKRAVALKMVHPSFAEREGYTFTVVQAFMREARILAAMEHQHVVAVHHAGTVGQCPFIAMPLIRDDLRRRISQNGGLLNPDAVYRVATGCAAALAIIHERGYLHGDVNPGNVLMSPEGEPLLAGFGHAIARADFSRGLSVLSSGSELLVERLAYIAPEARGGGQVDERSDLYSLGVTLWHVLTGGHRPPAQGASETLVQELVGRGANQDFARGMGEITARLLAPRADERWASAQELAIAYRELPQPPPMTQAIAAGGANDDPFPE